MLRGRKVLIVEDDSIIAGVYRHYLSQAGCEVKTVGDGVEAIASLADFRPDAVLLDLMLPHLNGIDVLKKIRSSENCVGLPVLVITTAFVPEMIKNSIAAGATQVLNKSTFTPSLLLVALRELLDKVPDSIAGCGLPIAD